MFVSALQKCAAFYLDRRHRDGVQSQELFSSTGEECPGPAYSQKHCSRGIYSLFHCCFAALNSKNLEANETDVCRPSGRRLSVLSVFRKVKLHP